MRFSLKLFLSIITVVIVSFSVGGYLLITSSFNSALEQEIVTALEESRMLRYSYEAALSGLSTLEQSETRMMRELSESIAGGGAENETLIRIYDVTQEVVFESAETAFETDILAQIDDTTRAYQIHISENRSFIQTVCIIQLDGSSLYFQESIRDISKVFTMREEQFRSFQGILLVMTLISGCMVFGLSLFLTKPIRKLSGATRRIAQGDLSRRVKTKSQDEIGALASDFNHMVEEVESRIHQLEDMNQKQGDFVASFAHELKTPLTSVIGYADMLRSKKLEPEDQFLAAEYIFKEGRRLEELSLKLLDMIVLGKRDFKKKLVAVSFLFEEVNAFLRPALEERELCFEQRFDEALLLIEPDLFLTLLINLLDNAKKASKRGGLIRLTGRWGVQGYVIEVQDEGKGIAQHDLSKVTEAFYVSDKSRARSNGGAGLGLTICKEIIRLHGGVLGFQSKLGEGTRVSIYMREVQDAEG